MFATAEEECYARSSWLRRNRWASISFALDILELGLFFTPIINLLPPDQQVVYTNLLGYNWLLGLPAFLLAIISLKANGDRIPSLMACIVPCVITILYWFIIWLFSDL